MTRVSSMQCVKMRDLHDVHVEPVPEAKGITVLQQQNPSADDSSIELRLTS